MVCVLRVMNNQHTGCTYLIEKSGSKNIYPELTDKWSFKQTFLTCFKVSFSPDWFSKAFQDIFILFARWIPRSHLPTGSVKRGVGGGEFSGEIPFLKRVPVSLAPQHRQDAILLQQEIDSLRVSGENCSFFQGEGKWPFCSWLHVLLKIFIICFLK